MKNNLAMAGTNPLPNHDEFANALRFLSMDAVEKAKSGHPGMPMGMADAATVLFSQFLKFDPKNPDWPDRDRFVLSAGHGSMLLYSLLYLTGYTDMTLEELQRFRQLGSKTAGHPEYGYAAGIETTTGPLGQGIANAVGMALAERIMNANFTDNLVSHFTYVIASDGDLMEGISHESCALAGHLRLNKLIVLYDDNEISIDGPTSLAMSDDQIARFKAYGWNAERINGHAPKEIAAAIARAQKSDKPSLIACRTTIGFGAPTKAGSHDSHGSPLGAEEIAGSRKQLNWAHAPFEIPAAILDGWRGIGEKGYAEFRKWEGRLKAADPAIAREFMRRATGDIPSQVAEALQAVKMQFIQEKAKIATRQASGKVIEAIQPYLPELIGGSADLTPSNNTKAKKQNPITAENYGGHYVHYGVREHGMAAAMNGMALHKGIIPYGGTFLIFTDYCRPAIRLSALMHQRVIYVMT
ncbi:MAG: transketolase family protein, partial [Dongiaceae bacterium]